MSIRKSIPLSASRALKAALVARADGDGAHTRGVSTAGARSAKSILRVIVTLTRTTVHSKLHSGTERDSLMLTIPVPAPASSRREERRA